MTETLRVCASREAVTAPLIGATNFDPVTAGNVILEEHTILHQSFEHSIAQRATRDTCVEPCAAEAGDDEEWLVAGEIAFPRQEPDYQTKDGEQNFP